MLDAFPPVLNVRYELLEMNPHPFYQDLSRQRSYSPFFPFQILIPRSPPVRFSRFRKIDPRHIPDAWRRYSLPAVSLSAPTSVHAIEWLFRNISFRSLLQEIRYLRVVVLLAAS